MIVDPASPAVSVSHFRMDFSGRPVVRDLSFEVSRGEIFGLLGSNGSGKTTTIRALLGIYEPTAGRLLVGGRPFRPDDPATRLGYLPEERGLYTNEPVLPTMMYFGRLKGMPGAEARAWSLSYLDRVGLGTHATTKIKALSGGQQQKIQLGVTIMNEPQLLILDEPTKGFDPVNRRLLMEIIAEQRARGATVVMVSHQMDEVQRICDHILLLKDGVARATGTIDEVIDRFDDGRLVRVVADRPIPASARYEVVTVPVGPAEPGPASAGTLLRLTEPDGGPAALTELVERGVEVRSYRPERKSLDDIFVEVYGEPDAGGLADTGNQVHGVKHGGSR